MIIAAVSAGPAVLVRQHRAGPFGDETLHDLEELAAAAAKGRDRLRQTTV